MENVGQPRRVISLHEVPRVAKLRETRSRIGAKGAGMGSCLMGRVSILQDEKGSGDWLTQQYESMYHY